MVLEAVGRADPSGGFPGCAKSEKTRIYREESSNRFSRRNGETLKDWACKIRRQNSVEEPKTLAITICHSSLDQSAPRKLCAYRARACSPLSNLCSFSRGEESRFAIR